MTNQQIILLLNEIEHNAGSIIIREQIEGVWTNCALTDLPAHLAVKHLCRIVRSRLRYEGPDKSEQRVWIPQS